MTAPSRIWACDGETPYFYQDGEDIPEAATEYVLAADLERVRNILRRVQGALQAENDADQVGADDANRTIAWICPLGLAGCSENCGGYGCHN